MKQLDEHTCDKIPKMYVIKIFNGEWGIQNSFDSKQFNTPIWYCPWCGQKL